MNAAPHESRSKVSPIAVPLAMSRDECPLGLRLNSGAAVDPKQKMLSVVLVQHCHHGLQSGQSSDTPAAFVPVGQGGPGLRWNEHIEGDGEIIFRHACKLGLEGIVF